MSRAFRGAAGVAHTLANNAIRSGNKAAAQQAQVISRLAEGLARLQAGLDDQAQQLTAGLVKLEQSLKVSRRSQRSKSGSLAANGELQNYYVDITASKIFGKANWPRAADSGLVGRRIGRGPVRMTGSDTQSAKAVTAAFAKLLSAQAQLLQIRSEVEDLKKVQR
ncbi:hypothetical protein RHEC894_PC00479 (plasmid) [Rhizobium sp. CIAT894]|uniref:hypothetical protein n=1 Tax=Rhizobium sp. CIAT894 TaxID=2020312 RepID=UPI000A1FCBDB|nr:hypothetical protein [Rhizobium sp. CIAT894]ARM91497.1 hypothetical protein RHEC894_PC00479 [Rhizobium sp. CIAT894]